MNMSNRIVKLVIVFSVLISGVGFANAKEYKSDIYLTQGEDFGFDVYMNKKAKGFVRKNNNEWLTFSKVVRLYNTETGRFLALSEEDKDAFNVAVNEIEYKLAKMKGKEAAAWLKKIEITRNVFTYVWEAQQIKAQPIELLEQPMARIEMPVGR